MNVLVAVSGGVDSVVLLHMLVTGRLSIPVADNGASCRLQGEELFSEFTSGNQAEGLAPPLAIAHFDHGMRPDSVADARFVRGLAARYGLEFVERREELSGASEERARARRYAFLFEEAEKRQARVVTAHHLDDVVETIALNIQRGTRWRGLACMSDERMERPLLNRTKSELEAYATEHRLEWVEDETNQQNIYSRNRMRRRLASLSPTAKQQLSELRQTQLQLRQEIRREIGEGDFPVWSRHFVTMIDEAVAVELLYEHILGTTGVSLLSEQLYRLLLAIKTGRPGTTWQLGGGVVVEMGKKDWCVAS